MIGFCIGGTIGGLIGGLLGDGINLLGLVFGLMGGLVSGIPASLLDCLLDRLLGPSGDLSFGPINRLLSHPSFFPVVGTMVGLLDGPLLGGFIVGSSVGFFISCAVFDFTVDLFLSWMGGCRGISFSKMLSPATVALLNEMVADLQFEHHEAIRKGHRAKAAWMLLVHYGAIARALTFDRAVDALAERARRIVGLGG